LELVFPEPLFAVRVDTLQDALALISPPPADPIPGS